MVKDIQEILNRMIALFYWHTVLLDDRVIQDDAACLHKEQAFCSWDACNSCIPFHTVEQDDHGS